MGRRLELHDIFESLLGSRYVYFQPPSKKKLEYPCIKYSRSKIDKKVANNQLYSYKNCYMAIIIDPDPDSLLVKKMLALPLCRFVQHYAADNLNHDVFNIYY